MANSLAYLGRNFKGARAFCKFKDLFWRLWFPNRRNDLFLLIGLQTDVKIVFFSVILFWGAVAVHAAGNIIRSVQQRSSST